MKKLNFILVIFWSFFASSLLYGQHQIQGRITDTDTGESLIGANVKITDSTIGTITDFDGNFNLEIPDKNVILEISYTGYRSQSIHVGNQSIIDIALSSGEFIDEVLVIGYGTQKKSDKTGAVIHVKADELNSGRLSDPIQGLQGKAAGVNISKKGGDPNAGFSVNIRGAAALTSGTEPLFVVDGVPGVDATTISSNDIESFNILKDASSTAIYGARGSNGVVIITTKGAKYAKNDEVSSGVEFNVGLSLDKVANKLDFLSASQVREFASTSGRTFSDSGGDVNWQDEIYRSDISQNYNLAFFGGDKNSYYRASLGYNDINGVLLGSGKKRTIGRLNLSQSLFDNKINLQARMSGTIEHNDYVNYGDGVNPTNVIYQAMRRNPTDPVRNEDGSFFETDKSFHYYNPVAIIEDIQNERDAKRLLGNLRASYNFYHNFEAAINLAYLRDDNENYYFEPSFTPSNQTNGFGRRSYDNKESSILEAIVKYESEFKDKQHLTAIAGYSYELDVFDGFSAQGKDAASDYLKSYNLGALINVNSGSIASYKNEVRLASFFGRAVYDYSKRYFLTGTIRRDGSSKFGANNEWGWFPSASMGWNILSESFMSNADVVSQLKFRLGYGIAGNQDIPNNVDAVYYVPNGTAIDPETGDVVISFENSLDIVPNPNLKWEQNAELNIGLDFGFWNDRISGTVEYYRKKTTNLIYSYELPVPPNKNRYIYANAGEIDNNGIEFTIQGYVMNRNNFDWKSLFTFAHNKQSVSLSSDEYSIDQIKTLYVSGRGLVGGENWTQIVRSGLEIGTFFLPEFAGFSEDGKFLFHTAAGGVTRDVTKAERRNAGSAQPDYTLGWSNYFNIGKHFDISLSLRAVMGYKVLNVTRMVFSNPSDLPTLNTLQEGIEEFNNGLKSDPIVSDYYLEDGSFLKLDNLSVGYNFSKRDIRLYLTGTNLFTISGYSGLDPELTYGGLEFGLDQYDVYPKTRSLTFGIQVKL